MEFKLEKEYQAWLGKQLRTMGCFFYKMSDGSIGKKPYDCYWVINTERPNMEIWDYVKY